MACGRCGASRSITPNGSRFGGAVNQQINQQNTDAVLLQYVGRKSAATPYTGPSKTRYWFANGDQKYVLAQDAYYFLHMSGFTRIEATPAVTPMGDTPILVAPGQA